MKKAVNIEKKKVFIVISDKKPYESLYSFIHLNNIVSKETNSALSFNIYYSDILSNPSLNIDFSTSTCSAVGIS